MAEKNRNRTTSISVSHETGAALTKLCEKLGSTKDEFLKAAVEYFVVNKIDPRTAGTLTRKEVDEVKKRLDQLFGFLKSQEKELIKPLVEENRTLNSQLRAVIINNIK